MFFDYIILKDRYKKFTGNLILNETKIDLKFNKREYAFSPFKIHFIAYYSFALNSLQVNVDVTKPKTASF